MTTPLDTSTTNDLDSFEEYLAKLETNLPAGKIAVLVWKKIEELVKDRDLILNQPCIFKSDDLIEMSWDRQSHHLEIEINKFGALNWFYRNRETNDLAGLEEDVPAAPLPEELLEKIWLLTHSKSI